MRILLLLLNQNQMYLHLKQCLRNILHLMEKDKQQLHMQRHQQHHYHHHHHHHHYHHLNSLQFTSQLHNLPFHLDQLYFQHHVLIYDQAFYLHIMDHQ